MMMDIRQSPQCPSPAFVDLRAIAHLTGLSARTLHTLLAAGLPSLRIRGRRLFEPAAVTAWLREYGSAPQARP